MNPYRPNAHQQRISRRIVAAQEGGERLHQSGDLALPVTISLYTASALPAVAAVYDRRFFAARCSGGL